MSDTAKPDADLDFEGHIQALEGAVRALESEELSLEDSLARYQGGVEHLRACRDLLDSAEARLAELVADAAGDVSERPLEVGERGLEDAGG